MKLIGEGKTVIAVAAQMGVTVQRVRQLLHQALETQSLYPSSLSAEQVGQLRQLSAERVMNLLQRGHQALEVVQQRLGSDEEKNMDATAAARLMEAGGRLEERLARLFGLDQPTKVVEESMRLQITEHQGTVKVTFDESQIAPDYSIDSGLSGAEFLKV